MFGKGGAPDRAEDRSEDRARVVAGLRRRLDGLGAGSSWGRPVQGGDAVVGQRGPAAAWSTEVSAGADSGVLAVPEPLAAVLPRAGVARGSVVSLSSTAPGRSGATSLLLAMLAAPHGVWTAVVGMPDLGVLAAAELGVDLDRLALIPDPGPDVLQVLSVLSDGVDVIAAAAPPDVPPARQRVLTGRLRQRGTVLLVSGRWPGADMTLTVTGVRWSGIGQGHGRLRDREIDVQVGGRRSGAGATATLLLRSTRTSVTVEPAAAARRAPEFDAVAEVG